MEHRTSKKPAATFAVALLTLTLGAALLVPGSVRAQQTAAEPSWEFSLKPYLFLSGLSGSVTGNELTFPINSSFSDLVDNLRIGGFISLAGVKGQWGFLADFEYISLQGGNSGRVPVDLRLDTTIGELDATFGPARDSSLKFVGGVRLFDVGQSLLIADEPTLEASATVVDPILGAIGAWEVGDHWLFQMRGDLGGFGIGSEFTYQLMLEFQWRISDSVGLPFGYRVLGYRIQQDQVELDIKLSGLFLGLDFRF